MYHIKMGRQDKISQWKYSSMKKPICLHAHPSYAIKEGKKFRAKTSPEELFFFFKVDQNGLVSNYYYQCIIYSLQGILPIPLNKKKKKATQPPI